MGKLMVGLGRFLPLCALLLVLPSLMHPDIVFAQKLTVAINPTQGSPGTSVTGTGTIGTINTGVFIGKPGDRIEVMWDDASYTTLANTTVRSDGSFSVSFIVPANATAGAHTIIFNDLSAGTSYVLGSPTFAIGQSSLPPPPPPPPTSPPTSQPTLPTPPPSNFPNAQHGIILSITQYSSTDITMEVAFDNFAAYRYPFQDHDCFNDGNEYHELYDADTGSLVVSSPRGAGGGIGYCGTFFQTTGNAWLHFLPIVLPTGNYWVHYHGTKVGDPAGYDWVTANFSYFSSQPTGKAPNLIVLVHGCCTDENDVVQDWGNGTPNKPGMAKAIADNIPSQTKKDWEVVVWDWSKYTSDLVPGPAYNAAQHQGNDLLGPAIAKYPYKYVHLIGHSAGARLIWLAAIKLAIDKVSNNKREEWPFIHLTFLDSYQPNDDDYGNLYEYPNYYSEHYVNRGSLIPLKADWPLTDPCLKNAFNFDITDWKNNDKNPNDPVSGHFWPVRWYKQSVTTPRFAYGYPLSFEGSNGSYDALSGWYLHHRPCYLTDVGTKCETGDKAPACW